MKIKTIVSLLNAKVHTGSKELLETEVRTACGSDMMSDVLAYVKDQAVLLTGLVTGTVTGTISSLTFRVLRKFPLT